METSGTQVMHTKILFVLLRLRTIDVSTTVRHRKLYGCYVLLMRTVSVGFTAFTVWTFASVLSIAIQTKTSYLAVIRLLPQTMIATVVAITELVLIARRDTLRALLVEQDRLCATLLRKRTLRTICLKAFFMYCLATAVAFLMNLNMFYVDHRRRSPDGHHQRVFNVLDPVTSQEPSSILSFLTVQHMFYVQKTLFFVCYLANQYYLVSVWFMCTIICSLFAELNLRDCRATLHVITSSSSSPAAAANSIGRRTLIDGAAIRCMQEHSAIVRLVIHFNGLLQESLGYNTLCGCASIVLRLRGAGLIFREAKNILASPVNYYVIDLAFSLVRVACNTIFILIFLADVNDRVKRSAQCLLKNNGRMSMMGVDRPDVARRRHSTITSKQVDRELLQYVERLHVLRPRLTLYGVPTVDNEIFLPIALLILSYTCITFGL